jgi:hypothetical protein
MQTDEQKDQEQQPIRPIGQAMMWPIVPGQPSAMSVPGVQPSTPMPATAQTSTRPSVQQAQDQAPMPMLQPQPQAQPAANPMPQAPQLPMPNKPAIAKLWDKTGGIDNTFAKIFARTGVGVLRGLETAGETMLPGAAMLVPGSILNTAVKNRQADQRAEKEQAMQQASRKTSAEETTAAAHKSEAETAVKREKFEEGKSVTHKTENLQQGYADAIRDALTNGRDPNTDPHVQAWKSAIADEKPKTSKHSAGEVKLDEGIPTGIYGEGDKLYRANDPNMPAELKAALADATGAHKQKVAEGLNQAREGRAVMAGSHGVNVMTSGGQIVGVDGLELPQFMKDNPGSVIVGAGVPTQAMGKQALISDIRVSAENVGKNLDVLDRKGFNYAKLAAALADPNNTAEAYLQAIPRGSLDDKGQQFVSDLFNLREQAMAMRSVLGAGQGSEDIRRAILQTLPGISSGSKGFGKKQLDNLLGVLGRLEKGVPSVPMRGGNGFEVPKGAPEAPRQDGKFLKMNGQTVAKSKGGKWVAP